MAITSSDLKFIASERMIDNLSTVAGVGGGGYMSQTVIVDGTENNVFPDVMPGDRTAGVVQLRQVYPIALSADNATLYNAKAGVLARPTDTNVEVAAFAAAGTSSAAAAAAVGTKWTGTYTPNGAFTSGGVGLVIDLLTGEPLPAVGDLVRVIAGVSPDYVPVDYGMRLVTAVAGGAGGTVTIDGSAFPFFTSTNSASVQRVPDAGAGTRVSAASLLTADAAAAATTVTVDKVWAAVHLPGASSLDTAGEPSGRSGTLPLYLPGDQLLFETGSTREAAVVSSVNYGTGVITLTAGLANAFATGSKMTRPVALGALQAAANNVFAQQAWTRAWSDTPIGSSVASRYGGSIAMVNEGGVTDRWACVFTTATQFNLISERLGQIATGSTTTDFLPLNPMTSEPYFTLLATGWGAGWLPGNVLRFNTRAASSPMWLSRLVKPSTAAGTVQATLFMRGDVDA
jgi:hypothetical protein